MTRPIYQFLIFISLICSLGHLLLDHIFIFAIKFDIHADILMTVHHYNFHFLSNIFYIFSLTGGATCVIITSNSNKMMRLNLLFMMVYKYVILSWKLFEIFNIRYSKSLPNLTICQPFWPHFSCYGLIAPHLCELEKWFVGLFWSTWAGLKCCKGIFSLKVIWRSFKVIWRSF